jgi:hypothetical protein
MTRLFQFLLVLTATVLCGFLSHCTVARQQGQLITATELEKGIRHQWKPRDVVLEDNVYETVQRKEVTAAINKAQMPYRSEIADCDDTSADALYFLRSARYRDGRLRAAPAAGRMAANYQGGQHSLVWFVEEGRFSVLDPLTGMNADNKSLKPWRVTCK